MTLYILSSLAGTVLLGLLIYLAFRMAGKEPRGRVMRKRTGLKERKQ